MHDLPELPSGHRWAVEKDSWGDIVVRIKKEQVKLFGRRVWKTIRSSDVTSYYTTTPSEQLPDKVLAAAKRLLSAYQDDLNYAAAKDALLGYYKISDKEDL